MSWLDAILNELEKPEHWGYRVGEQASAEPTALAALALLGHGRAEGAKPALAKLCEFQTPDGGCGLNGETTSPHWTTPWAVLAWTAAVRALPPGDADAARYKAAVVRADEFLFTIPSTVFQTTGDPQVDDIGHNGMLRGWPWVGGTHSWLEPTAMAFLALKASGRRAHPRADEAVRLMIDRILPGGGCNYGNTLVLGQVLRPHLQPTGIVLSALGGEAPGNERIAKSLAYLERTVDDTTAAASLSYAVLGLAAHGRRLPAADRWLEAAATKPTFTIGADRPRRALLALAALGDQCPLIVLPREGVAS